MIENVIGNLKRKPNLGSKAAQEPDLLRRCMAEQGSGFECKSKQCSRLQFHHVDHAFQAACLRLYIQHLSCGHTGRTGGLGESTEEARANLRLGMGGWI